MGFFTAYILFVFVLYFCFIFCVFYVFCIVFILFCVLFLLSCCLFPIFVQVYRPLPPGVHPIAVNKYRIISYIGSLWPTLGTTYRGCLQAVSSPKTAWPLNMELIGCIETSQKWLRSQVSCYSPVRCNFFAWWWVHTFRVWNPCGRWLPAKWYTTRIVLSSVIVVAQLLKLPHISLPRLTV